MSSSLLLPGRPPLSRKPSTASKARPLMPSTSTPMTKPTSSTASAALPLVGIAGAAAAAFLAARLFPEEIGDENSSTRECPTCNGTGVEACACTRWSDGDGAGCGSCGGSLVSSCRHCGGGGKAVPIARRVHVERTPSPYERR